MASRECWMGVLVCTTVGLLFSMFALSRDEKDWYYSRYGFEFSVSILGGRAFEPRPKPRDLPLLPKTVLISLLSTLSVFFIFLYSACPRFLNEHWLFSVLWLTCTLSTGAWLWRASAFQEKAQAADFAQVNEFLSNAAAPVPHGPEKPPPALKVWNYANLSVFLGLVLTCAFYLWGGA